LIEEVARQVAQRVENLRLLFGAEHFRAEAEKAARLMTREGWLAYLQSTDDQVQGYKYTKGKVEELTNVADSGGVERSLVRRSLSIRGENIGHLELDLGADLDEESAVLVSAVAEQLSAHLEHLRLTDQKNLALEKTEDQANRLALLNELSQALASASNEDEVLRIAAEKTGLIVPADHINIALTNEPGESLQILILNGLQGLTEVGDLIPTKDSALGIATQENRVLIVNESTAAFSGASISGGGILLDKLVDDFLGDGSTIESFVVAPMRSGRGVLGALSVGRKESASFSNFDAGLLLQAASLIGGTIESRRLLAETERKARDLALINRVARAVSQQLEFDKLLETFYEQISAAMAPDAFLIGLFDPETRLMDYPLMVESGNRNRQFGVRLHPESNSYKVMKSGKPILSNSSADQQRVLKSEQQGGLGREPTKKVPASLLYVPLRVGHRTNGVLSIQSYHHNKYQPSDVALLESIANYVAIAIDNARLFEHVRSRVRREQILRNVTDRVRRTEDVNEVLKTAATEIGRVLGRKTHVYLDNSEDDASLDTPEDGQDGKS
jgi:GAF domain-containing protein